MIGILKEYKYVNSKWYITIIERCLCICVCFFLDLFDVW